MPNLSKISIPVAKQGLSHLDLSCDHVTSMDFMSLQPVFYRHMVSGEHLKFDSYSVVRPAPMSVPTYGRLRQNIRSFFVPYRLLFKNYNEFKLNNIASSSDSSGIPYGVPYIMGSVIMDTFVRQVGTLWAEVSDVNKYDFIFQNDYYLFTHEGRRAYKILRSLGYDINANKDVAFNVFGLLAMFKIYYDWFTNSQYLNNSDLLSVVEFINSTSQINAVEMSSDILFKIISLITYVNYDSEGYYDAAWDNPVAPTNGNFSSVRFNDITAPTVTDGSVDMYANGTPFMVTRDTGNIGTTYLHTVLKKLSDYQKRHALAGARSIDRMLAEVGVTTDYLRLQRSIYVGFDSIDINIGDIYATANGSDGSQSSQVGDYAGRGFGNGKKNWDFSTDEDGVFICLASIIPSAGYCQGVDRHNLHVNRYDFFTDQFDALGVQEIRKCELYSPVAGVSYTGDVYEEIFGYTGRYGEYKRPRSMFTGDLSLKSAIRGGDSWTLFRKLGVSLDSNNNPFYPAHSEEFTKGRDMLQYHRIFNYIPATINEAFDPFYCFFHFDVGSYFPGKPLFDSYEFDDVKRSVTLNSNGVELN